MKAIPGEYPLIVLGAERKTHNEFQFDDEAVIIPLVSSTGHGHRSMKRIFFQTGKFSIGSILCAVIPKDKTQLSAEFLYRYLDFNKQNELVGRMKGMANVSLPMKEIADVEIPLPPLEIQKELIEEFQKLESGTNQISTELNHQLALVKELRQAYLKEAMQGKLARQDSTDEPAEILLEKIKAEKEKLVAEKRIKRDKPLPPINAEEIPFEIPSNWTWCRLGETAEITRGKSPKYSETGLFKMLNQKCVRWFSIDKSYAKAIEKEWFETVKEDFIVRSGDILVNSTGEGTIGRSAIADFEVDGFIFDSHILKLSSRINQN
jgi:type I restriction enzyme S subunit